MVRLRSNRWYSAAGQGRSRGTVGTKVSNSRRVLSLCLLLALVVVLMQKAADPRHVRNAFQALGVPLDEQARGQGTVDTPPENLQPVALSEEQTRWRTTCRDLVPRLLGHATDAEVAELSRQWFAVDRNQVAELIAESIAEVESVPRAARASQPASDSRAPPRLREQTTQQLVELQLGLSEQTTAESSPHAADENAWASQLERFSREWQTLWQTFDLTSDQASPAIGRLSPELSRAWVEYLDQRLLASLRDARPWTKAESTAFWRLLQRGQKGDAGGDAANTEREPPLLNTLQLEAEFLVYRGQSVRYRGTVRRADRIDRGEPNFGIEQYWSLWLRGDDESPQPITVYTTQAVAKQLERAVQSEQFPRIEVLGIVGKRLAYAAPAGVEVAPTLFATSIIQFADPPPPASGPTSAEMANDFGWAVLIGCLVAACGLLPILANWRRRATRLGRTGSSKLIVFGILLANPLAMHAQPLQDASATPPWARADSASAGNIFSERLQATLNAAAADELRTYQQTRQTDFPAAALKLLTALRQVGWEDALPKTWDSPIPAADLIARRETISGWVRLATPVRLSPEQQAWFQADETQALYRLEVETTPPPHTPDNPSRLTSVYCISVPSAWLTASRLLQPVTVQGVSLFQAQRSVDNDTVDNDTVDNDTVDNDTVDNDTGNLSEIHDEIHSASAVAQQRWCMFAKGPQWRLAPGDAMQDFLPAWNERQQRLAQLGWDLAYLDTVRQHSQQPLRAPEAAAFYTLLRGTSPPLASEGTEQTLLQVLAEPREMVGARVNWPVRLVSGSLVTVPDGRYREWLGAERYYQFDGLVDIGRQTVQYNIAGAADEAGVKFEGEFPVTIIMRETSPFVPAEALAAGQLSWAVGEYVQVSGLFYRLWSYESELMSGQPAGARQAAPLVMANRLTRSAPAILQTATTTGWFGYALTMTIVGILAVILWSAFHKPKKRLRFRSGATH